MNELSEIDLKQIVLSKIKLLLGAPLLIAIGVFVVTNLMPPTYVSFSYLDVMADIKYADAVMRSPLVLDSDHIKSLLGKDLDEAGKKELERKFKFNTSKLDQRDKPKFVILEVRDNSPEGAKALANALIDAWLDAYKPRGAAKLELERRLIQNREALLVTSNLISRLDFEAKNLVVANIQFDLAESIVKLHARRDELKNLIIDLEMKLEGPPRQLVVIEPSLPKYPEKNNASVYAVLAMISSALVLFLGLAVKQSFCRR